MNSPEVIQLFPTPVLIFKYEENFEKELDYIRKIDYRKKDNNSFSYNSQSVDTFLLDKQELSKIKTFIEQSIDCYVKNIMKSSRQLVITQSWANKSLKNESHHEHIHPNSIVSGVFYFKIDKLPPIRFKNSKVSNFGLEVIEQNNFNSFEFYLPAKDGELIIFPSDLQHSVPVNNSDEERISLSFNTFAKGNIGSIDTLTYLPFERCL